MEGMAAAHVVKVLKTASTVAAPLVVGPDSILEGSYDGDHTQRGRPRGENEWG